MVADSIVMLSSDAKIDVIIVYIVNSGLLTSVCMICSLASVSESL